MSNNKISGSEYSLSKIFSSEFEYIIPSYQRPYAWGKEQVEELFDDLLKFYRQNDTQDENYFLGSIVLIQENDQIKKSEVIDGQQRLTTLTILLALLASKMDAEQREEIRKSYIWEPGKKYEKLQAKPRLTLRKRDADFFQSYVQSLKFQELFGLDEKQLESEARINIKRNSQALDLKIESEFKNNIEEIDNFITFLVMRCFLITVITSSQNTAFLVFSVMNSRGLDLQVTDILKADIIGLLTTTEDQNDYSEKWEELESSLGREDFNNLFSHIRMIKVKAKAQRSLLEEFKNNIFPIEPKSFIDQSLTNYADAYNIIRECFYKADKHAEDVNHYLKWLNRIEGSDWIPVSLEFMVNHKNKPDYMSWFFKRLERLAAYMYICGLDINKRIDRYKQILNELTQEHSLEKPVLSVELTLKEKERFIAVLDSDIYLLPSKKRNYVILRLDSFISDKAVTYDSSRLTIEHVLPQTIEDNSEWQQLWCKESIDKWIHRLANLVPLNKRRNSQARNYNFSKKKEKYFKGSSDVSSYALTSQILNEIEWTPDIVQKRQSELLDVFKNNWQLI